MMELDNKMARGYIHIQHYSFGVRQGAVSHMDVHIGIPDVITSDRGSQFTYEPWRGCGMQGIMHSPIKAYHQQASGLVEQ